jgi:hypothetical protein
MTWGKCGGPARGGVGGAASPPGMLRAGAGAPRACGGCGWGGAPRRAWGLGTHHARGAAGVGQLGGHEMAAGWGRGAVGPPPWAPSGSPRPGVVGDRQAPSDQGALGERRGRPQIPPHQLPPLREMVPPAKASEAPWLDRCAYPRGVSQARQTGVSGFSPVSGCLGVRRRRCAGSLGHAAGRRCALASVTPFASGRGGAGPGPRCRRGAGWGRGSPVPVLTGPVPRPRDRAGGAVGPPCAFRRTVCPAPMVASGSARAPLPVCLPPGPVQVPTHASWACSGSHIPCLAPVLPASTSSPPLVRVRT